jgi:HIRAN domain-containing protein
VRVEFSYQRRSREFVSEDGTRLLGAGLEIWDAEGRAVLWDDYRRIDPAARNVKVAGAHYREEALQSDAFAPGSRLALVPEPDNQYDPQAIKVLDARETEHVGYVPAELCADLHELLAANPDLAALVAWEWRLEDGSRSALRALVAPPELAARAARALVAGR